MWKRIKAFLGYDLPDRISLYSRIILAGALFVCVLMVFYCIWYNFYVSLEIASRAVITPVQR